MDFTVIQSVRQRFGDEADPKEVPLEPSTPFVGPSKEFPFRCPKVDSHQQGVLQFESFGVGMGGFFTPGFTRSVLRINGVNIPGGITPGPGLEDTNGDIVPVWKSHSLIVGANTLKEENVLQIEASLMQIAFTKRLDNFIIDNVVVFFKTVG
jgi:hypothetical protein